MNEKTKVLDINGVEIIKDEIDTMMVNCVYVSDDNTFEPLEEDEIEPYEPLEE